MDRYLAWLISDYMLNRGEAEESSDYVPKIFKPTNFKIAIWLIILAALLSFVVVGFGAKDPEWLQNVEKMKKDPYYWKEERRKNFLPYWFLWQSARPRLEFSEQMRWGFRLFQSTDL